MTNFFRMCWSFVQKVRNFNGHVSTIIILLEHHSPVLFFTFQGCALAGTNAIAFAVLFGIGTIAAFVRLVQQYKVCARGSLGTKQNHNYMILECHFCCL